VKMRLLLVEDEADARESLLRSMTRAGNDCIGADGAAEALKAVVAAPPVDVCVVDVRLGPRTRRGFRSSPSYAD